MCATAALRDNTSNWGEKGGCLGFFEYSFSLHEANSGHSHVKIPDAGHGDDKDEDPELHFPEH